MDDHLAGEPDAAAGDRRRARTLVWSLGETLIDLIATDAAGSLESASEFAARPGGAPANVAVALARLGVPAAFLGVVGDDPFGVRLRAGLGAEGVDVARVRLTSDRPTTLAFAWKDARGDGHFWLLRGADTLLSTADVDAAGVAGAAALVVGSVALAAEPSRTTIVHAIRVARGAGVAVCFDVNLRPTLWPSLDRARAACVPLLEHATLVKLSLDDARGLFEPGIEPADAIRRVVEASTNAMVVLTDGERGCWFSDSEHGIGHVPAFAVAAVEPTGAGDAFTAALLSRMIDGGWRPPTHDDVRFAAAAGALATTRRGAWEGLPTRAKLDRFLETAARSVARPRNAADDHGVGARAVPS